MSLAEEKTRNVLPMRSDRALSGIYEISKILCGPGELRQLLATTLNVLHSFMDMGNAVIALLSETGDPEAVISASLDYNGSRQYFSALPERVIGQMVVTGMPVLVQDVGADTNFGTWDTTQFGPPGKRYAFMGVPLPGRDGVVGVMTIDCGWERESDLHLDDDIGFLKMAANLVSQTVRLHRLVTRDRDRMLADQRRLEKEREDLVRPRHANKTRILGESSALRGVLDQVRRIARSDATVLLRGESGTGKELFAEAIHEASPRHGGPFIKLNCAALPESVLESELFGHEKGSFTGAMAQRKGRFELADGGTLFLDEIGEISPAFQAKLLRVLQEGEFERVGGTRTLKVNVRLVSATNRDLEEAVAKGTFRADLYYRIAVVPVFLPALRDRVGDIPILANAFLDRFNQDNKTSLAFTNGALNVLQSCYFPGNIRELENCVRRTATLARGDTVVERDLSCRNDGCLSSVLWRILPKPASNELPIIAKPEAARPKPVEHPEPLAAPAEIVSASTPPKPPRVGGLSDHDRLIDAMERAGWVQAKAARLLNLTPRQVGYALRRHHIQIKKF